MPLLWFLVLLAALLALLSLRGDAAKACFWAQPAPVLAAPPPVTLIVPVKGHDEGLLDNLAALAAQDYPDFELIVCARAPEDIPVGVVPAGARVVYSHAPDPHTGEKIQNLLAAIAAARPASTVLAFADSDARPLPHWLHALTAAALDPATGVATGYRWYIPERGVASHLRSAWNSVIAGGYGPAPAAFCWGGAMAIRRELFEPLAIRDAWRAQVSDDYAMSARVRAAGLRIAFVPGALTPARDHTSTREFLHWSARQLLLTRVYRPELWRLALFAHVVYCAALPAAAVLALNGHAAALAPLALQLAIGMTKAARRVRWAATALGQPAGSALLHAAQAPAATWLWLYALLASSFGDILNWRGVRYRLSRDGCERLG